MLGFQLRVREERAAARRRISPRHRAPSSELFSRRAGTGVLFPRLKKASPASRLQASRLIAGLLLEAPGDCDGRGVQRPSAAAAVFLAQVAAFAACARRPWEPMAHRLEASPHRVGVVVDDGEHLPCVELVYADRARVRVRAATVYASRSHGSGPLPGCWCSYRHSLRHRRISLMHLARYALGPDRRAGRSRRHHHDEPRLHARRRRRGKS